MHTHFPGSAGGQIPPGARSSPCSSSSSAPPTAPPCLCTVRAPAAAHGAPMPSRCSAALGLSECARFLFLRSGPALPPDLQARICHLLADGPPARLTAPHTQCVFPAQPVVFPPRLAPHPSVAPSATLVAPARNLRISFESLPLTKTVSLPLAPVDSAP